MNRFMALIFLVLVGCFVSEERIKERIVANLWYPEKEVEREALIGELRAYGSLYDPRYWYPLELIGAIEYQGGMVETDEQEKVKRPYDPDWEIIPYGVDS